MHQHFISDNSASIHPTVLEILGRLNQGHEPAYGQDSVTAQARALFKAEFGPESEVFFTTTGTASNVLALKSVLEPFEAVICADSAHLNRDECGAPEAILGNKLITLPAEQGKLTPALIQTVLRNNDMVHRVQPRVVSIAQCTEWGTVYTLAETQELADFCHHNDLLLHLDGARLANAACALDVSLGEVCLQGGIDMLSLGGTKNGLIGAEAVVFFNTGNYRKTAFLQKQLMQLSSKMRFISAQFVAFFTDQLWQQNARHANRMTRLLAELVGDTVEFVMPVESNVIFAKLPAKAIVPLQAEFPFAMWDPEQNIARWMTAFDTEEATVQVFAQHIKTVINDHG